MAPDPTSGAGAAPDPNQILLQVTQLLGQLTAQVNSQPVPEPVPFNPGSGRPFADFFSEFEAYALKIYGSNRELWIPRLAKYLEEPILSLFNNLSQVNQDYSSIKTALLNTYGSTKSSPADFLEKFNHCKYDQAEGIKGFISRLNALALKAYTGAPQDTIDELVKRHCISSLPGNLSTALNFWLLSNPSASLQELMRVGSGLEKSLPTPEAAAMSAPVSGESTPPPTAAVHQKSLPNSSSASSNSGKTNPQPLV